MAHEGKGGLKISDVLDAIGVWACLSPRLVRILLRTEGVTSRSNPAGCGCGAPSGWSEEAGGESEAGTPRYYDRERRFPPANRTFGAILGCTRKLALFSYSTRGMALDTANLGTEETIAMDLGLCMQKEDSRDCCCSWMLARESRLSRPAANRVDAGTNSVEASDGWC